MLREIGPVTKGFGETPHTQGVACWMIAWAVPNLVVSTVLVAFTLTTLGAGATGGGRVQPARRDRANRGITSRNVVDRPGDSVRYDVSDIDQVLLNRPDDHNPGAIDGNDAGGLSGRGHQRTNGGERQQEITHIPNHAQNRAEN